MSVTPPATVEQAIERLEALSNERDELSSKLDALSRENKILREELQAYRLARFGRQSERLEPGQLSFFEQGEPPAPPAEESAPPADKGKRKKRKPGHGRGIFPDHLPREIIELDVPEEERICPCCGAAMRPIGEDVCERGHIVPAKLVVRRYVKKKYACADGHGVTTAKAPSGVIDKGKYEASVYAHVVASKYTDHLPLHRLEGIFKRYGVHLPKQTMWDLLVTVDDLVAQPILEQMKAELLTEPVLHADETSVTMRLEGGKGTRKSYAWVWRNLTGVGPSKVLIDFRASRSRDGPLDFLGDWSGTLIADGYSGYDEVVRRNELVRAGCLAHARRKLKDALDGLSPKEFFCPGSTLHACVDTAHPAAYGMPADSLVFFWNSRAFEILPSGENERYEVVASYPERDILESGWLIGEEKLRRRAAMVVTRHGQGKVVLIGFRPQHRAQTHGTYKLLFNSLYS